MNIWAFDFLYDLTVHVIYRIDITVSLFYPCFLAANFTIYCLNFTERIDSLILVYCMKVSKSDVLDLYRKGHLAIVLFITFTLSSEFDCLIIISFPKFQFLTQQTEKETVDYLENEKSFFDKIKSICHSFWRATIWWKNKNLIKIADTSFNS